MIRFTSTRQKQKPRLLGNNLVYLRLGKSYQQRGFLAMKRVIRLAELWRGKLIKCLGRAGTLNTNALYHISSFHRNAHSAYSQ